MMTGFIWLGSLYVLTPFEQLLESHDFLVSTYYRNVFFIFRFLSIYQVCLSFVALRSEKLPRL